MENRNNKGLRTLVIITLIIAVAGISVAFAALSQTLTITATGEIHATDWDIKWTDAEGKVLVGASNGADEGTNSSIPSTTITLSDIVLIAPGDKIEWTFTAENLGDIDAELESITNLLAKNITIHNEEESDISENDIIVTIKKAGGGAIAAGDALDAGTTQDYVLTIEFDPNFQDLPSHNVTITAITILFPWVQK